MIWKILICETLFYHSPFSMDQLTVAARCRLAGWLSAAFTQLFLASETDSDEAEEQEEDLDEDYETVAEEEDSEDDEVDENDEDNEDNEGPDEGHQRPVADQPTDIDLD
jgi:hypothetical protein